MDEQVKIVALSLLFAVPETCANTAREVKNCLCHALPLLSVSCIQWRNISLNLFAV